MFNKLMPQKKYALTVGAVLTSSIAILTTVALNMRENDVFYNSNNSINNILNNSDFVFGLKKIAQLEYAVGDTAVNVNQEDDTYKTFENNKNFEIFINKKSGEISSLHYTSSIENFIKSDNKHLKNVYNLTFLSISSYLFEKTSELINMMCSDSYISNKSALISKNGFISESIPLGKTSEIKITVIYNTDDFKNTAESVDIAILKGNKY